MSESTSPSPPPTPSASDISRWKKCLVKCTKDTHDFLQEHSAYTLPFTGPCDRDDPMRLKDDLLTKAHFRLVRDCAHKEVLEQISTMPELKDWVESITKEPSVREWFNHHKIDTNTNPEIDYAKNIQIAHRNLVSVSRTKMSSIWLQQGREWGSQRPPRGSTTWRNFICSCPDLNVGSEIPVYAFRPMSSEAATEHIFYVQEAEIFFEGMGCSPQ